MLKKVTVHLRNVVAATPEIKLQDTVLRHLNWHFPPPPILNIIPLSDVETCVASLVKYEPKFLDYLLRIIVEHTPCSRALNVQAGVAPAVVCMGCPGIHFHLVLNEIYSVCFVLILLSFHQSLSFATGAAGQGRTVSRGLSCIVS